jgi:hypothetical protein
MTALATDAQPEKSSSLPLWVYPAAVVVGIPAAIIALWLLPMIGYIALTAKLSTRTDSAFLTAMYFVSIAAVFTFSLVWPLLAVYGISQLF